MIDPTLCEQTGKPAGEDNVGYSECPCLPCQLQVMFKSEIALHSELRDYEQTTMRLNTENARLHSEVEKLRDDVRMDDATIRELRQRLIDEQKRSIAYFEAERVSLTADLARVTAERDGLTADRNAMACQIDHLRRQWDAEVNGTLALRRECGARLEETFPEFVRRVTGERDGLLAAAKLVLVGQVVNGCILPNGEAELRAAVAACAPASGKEG